MLSFVNRSIMLSVITLDVVMLSVDKLNAIMLNFVNRPIMLSVIKLYVIILSVVAPLKLSLPMYKCFIEGSGTRLREKLRQRQV